MKPPQSKQSKEYNSNGRVDPVIRNAVSSGNWHGATHSKLSEALHLFRTHTPRLDYMRIAQDGIQFKGWLEKVCEIPWDDTARNEMTETAMSISVYARYDMMLRYQAKCSDDGDRKKINEILCYLRDAVTLMAIHMSRGYKDQDAWRTALSIMQHDLTVNQISLCRSWRARTTTCSTTCRTHGCQGVREEETDQLGPAVNLVQLDLRVLRVEPRALQWTKATSQASRPRGRRPRERAQASHMHTRCWLCFRRTCGRSLLRCGRPTRDSMTTSCVWKQTWGNCARVLCKQRETTLQRKKISGVCVTPCAAQSQK